MSKTNFLRLSAALVVLFVASACETVSYNPATNPDSTPPKTNVLIKRYGHPDLEVQNQNGPSANVANAPEPLPPNGSWAFSVLATATDAESGIRHLKLNLMRTVCYISSGGTIAKAYYGTVTRKEATYSDQSHAPTQASLGDTGVIDNTTAAINTPTDDNLLVWTNANQDRAVGVGVWTRWGMETTNFAGRTTYSDVITIVAGDLSCNPP